MLNFFTLSDKNATPITPIITTEFTSWLTKQSKRTKALIAANNFTANSGNCCLLPDNNGNTAEVLLGIENYNDILAFAALPARLKHGAWHINVNVNTAKNSNWSICKIQKCAIAWALGNYQYTKYKKQNNKLEAKLYLPKNCDYSHIENVVNAIFLVRDLINQPAEHLGPAELAKIAVTIAKQHKAQIKQIIGDDLLTQNYPLVHAVGRASERAPRVVEFFWGKQNAPKLAIIGKGICFDSGGLDLKPPNSMEKMKKDMAGAAHALGLANMIMTAKLPVNLHVILPIAENLVAASSYKPGDIITSRKGTTVEILNTDAEGRLLLADAITRATEKKPDLIIDMASLTGAATIALGPEIISMFTNNDILSANIEKAFAKEQDLIWRMPLHKPYRKLLDSKIADISNCSLSGYAGSVTAALFLQEFVTPNIQWLHLDLMGANVKPRPGHPEGGEAMGLEGLFAYIRDCLCAY